MSEIHTLDLSSLKAGESIIIGRNINCDIVIDNEQISGEHLKISISESCAYLRDLQSRSGVTLNGGRISGICRIRHLDSIEIPGQVFQVKLPASLAVSGASITAETISYQVQNGKKILSNISFSALSGELVGIIGPSGCGKSTLIDILAGNKIPSTGCIKLNGETLSPEELKARSAYLPQSVIVSPKLSLRESLHYSRRLFSGAGSVENAIEQSGMDRHADTETGLLSGGQQKRAGLAGELLFSPELICLDEVTSGLDPLSEQEMMIEFRALSNMGKTILCITHYPERLILCDRLLVLMEGELIFSGTPAETMKHFSINALDKLYGKLQEHYAAYWIKRNNEPQTSGPSAIPVANSSQSSRKQKHPPLLSQLLTLILRSVHIWLRSPGELAFSVIQGVLIGILIGICFGTASLDRADECARNSQIIFALVLASIWIGSTSSIREVVKERRQIFHEMRRGLAPSALVLSKLLVLGALSALNTATATALAMVMTGLQATPWLLLGTLLTGTLAACSMGLAISALCSTQEKALSILPVVIIALVMFSGGISKLESSGARAGKNICFSSWCYDAAKHAIDPHIRNTSISIPVIKHRTIAGKSRVKVLAPLSPYRDSMAVILLSTLLFTSTAVCAVRKQI